MGDDPAPALPWPRHDRVPPLADNQVHVLQTLLDRPESEVSHWERLLAPHERQRADRFHFRRDRLRYIVGRGTLRLLLAEYLAVGPGEVRLWYTSHGKPELSGEMSEAGLRLNVAHSGPLALFAFARRGAVGVDVEYRRPDLSWRELAERYFAPREVAELNTVPVEQQQQAFYAGWTRKEAYMKALGLGMALPLDRFAVSLTPGRPAELLSAEHDPDQLGRWQMWHLDPAPGYAGALVAEGQNRALWCGRWEKMP